MLLCRCSCCAESEKRSWWELVVVDLGVREGKVGGREMGGSDTVGPARRVGREGIEGGRWGV